VQIIGGSPPLFPLPLPAPPVFEIPSPLSPLCNAYSATAELPCQDRFLSTAMLGRGHQMSSLDLRHWPSTCLLETEIAAQAGCRSGVAQVRAEAEEVLCGRQ
jgi:hypothetical protein